MNNFVLPEKLPKLRTKEDFAMTKEDWQEYFECRKKYDRPQSLHESIQISIQAIALKESGKSNKEITKFYKEHHYLVSADAAIGTKKVWGLKAIQEYNLFEAKEKYPDEF